MHPILRQQIRAILGQPGPEKARLEALVQSVHEQYRRFEKELRDLESRLETAERVPVANPLAKEGEAGLQVLLDNIKDGIISVDALGRIRSMNLTAERMFGRQAAELVGQSLGLVMEIPGARREGDYLKELSRVRENTQLDLSPTAGMGRRSDGRSFPLDVVASATEVDGRRIYVLAIRDNSERLEAERALRESEARYRSLVDGAPEAIVLLDPESGKFADANNKALKLLRTSRSRLLESTPAQFSPPQQPDGRPSAEASKRQLEAVLNGSKSCFEWLHRGAPGAHRVRGPRHGAGLHYRHSRAQARRAAVGRRAGHPRAHRRQCSAGRGADGSGRDRDRDRAGRVPGDVCAGRGRR